MNSTHSHSRFEITVGSLISSASSDYEVQHLLGSGSFGAVTQCRKVATDQTVALKILRNRKGIQDGKKEEAILKILKELGSDGFNIVAWKDSFSYEGSYCLEFEKLDINLNEFQERSQHKSLAPMKIRPIVHQLAEALNFLKHAGIVHADLKPENIMMVDHIQQPLRVKIIDFGLAVNNPGAHEGAILQSLWYRSPEILLGASFDEAIDVWSLGCIAVELFMGTPLFPFTDEYDVIKSILSIFETPPDRLLNEGMHTRLYFDRKYGGEEPNPWRFMSVTEVGHINCNIRTISSLDDLNMRGWKVLGEDADIDNCDRRTFIQLVGEMLRVDPAQRIGPHHILQHPFITMSHLMDKSENSLHVKYCAEQMRNLQNDITNNGDEAQLSVSTGPAEISAIEGQSDGSIIKKRPRSSDDEEDCKIPSKRRTVESLHEAPTSPDKQMEPPASQKQKRKRDEPDPCQSSKGSPPYKTRRSRNCNKDKADCDNKKLCNFGNVSTAQESPFKKRKRANEEASGSDGTESERRRGREQWREKSKLTARSVFWTAAKSDTKLINMVSS